MLDIFSIYSKGKEIYIELQKTHPNIDVVIPALAEKIPGDFKIILAQVNSNSMNKVSMPVNMDFSSILRCSFVEIEQKIQDYLSSLQNSSLTLNKDFGVALQKLLYPEGIFLFHTMFSLLQKYCVIPEEEFHNVSVIFKILYPARIVIIFENKSVVYDFATKNLIFSGMEEFIEKSIDFPLEVSEIKFSPTLVLENNCPGDSFIFCSTLNEGIDVPEQETSNDVLDKVIQNLILLDMLDALQDVWVDEENSGIILCFDPVLNNEEINLILNSIKQKYAGAKLTNTPTKDDLSPWWIIEIYKSEKVQNQVQQSYTLSPLTTSNNSDSSLENKGTISIEDLAKEINMDSLVQSINKG